MGEILHGDGGVREKCLAICKRFNYPTKGFELVIWAVIVGWIIFGLGNTYRLWYWEMDMAKKRQVLHQEIQVLQDYIKNNDIGQRID